MTLNENVKVPSSGFVALRNYDGALDVQPIEKVSSEAIPSPADFFRLKNSGEHPAFIFGTDRERKQKTLSAGLLTTFRYVVR